MRTLSTLFASMTVTASFAQLVNGSFENNGLPDLSGWEYLNCYPPTSLAGGAPGAGQWYARKNYSETQGCFTSQLIQRLPAIADGDVRTLSGWVRTEAGMIQPYAGLAIGSISGGVLSYDLQAQTIATAWTYLTVTDTFHLGASDTAVVVLHPGLVGGALFGHANFDGIELSPDITQGIAGGHATTMTHYPDPTTDILMIHHDQHDPIGAWVVDLSGRAVPVTIHTAREGTLEVDVSTLTPGVYLVRLALGQGESVFRFVKE
jgi:hypothetical protein